MYRFSFPEKDNHILFEAVLEPSEILQNKSDGSYDGEGSIKTLLGKENKMAIGAPYCENLISRITEENREIPHEIKKMIIDYDYYFIRLSCSFLPDAACKFIWARFGMELVAASKETDELIQEKPIAVEIFPDEIINEVKYHTELNFDSKINCKFTPFDANIGYANKENKEFIKYEPQIFAYGINRSSITWDFKATSQKGIYGDKKNLIIIVRNPKNTKLKGKFILGGEVQSGNGAVIPLKKRDDDVVNKEYELSK